MAGRGEGPALRRIIRAGRPAALYAAVCEGAYGAALAVAMGAARLVDAM